MSLHVSNYGICTACSQPIKSRQFLKCCLCLKLYDIECANVSEKRFYNTMTLEHKNKWECSDCKKRVPKCDIKSTPIKHLEPSIMMTRNKTAKSKPTPTQPHALSLAPSDTNTDCTTSASNELITELRLLREEMKAVRTEMKEFRDTISHLTTAVEVCNQRIDDLAERVDAIEQQRERPAETTSDTASLVKTITELKLGLNDRDQELLSNDIEIAGIPEESGERCAHLVLTVAQKLGVKLEDRDLVSVERAGPVRRPAGEGDPAPRPRPLVVRLARRVQRNELLAAARVRRDTTTAGLGMSTTPSRIFLNERLTSANRQLFYRAREESSRVQWKYVWTRDGKIFARREHGSPRHRLRSEADLSKVFGGC